MVRGMSAWAGLFRLVGMVIMAACLSAGITGAAMAGQRVEVPAGQDALRRAVAAARPGDVLHLLPGVHAGPVTVSVPLTLEGDGDGAAVVMGNGEGSTILILAPDVTVRGITVHGSGKDGEAIDGGIHAKTGADRPVIENNRVDDALFGIVIHGAQQAVVRNNRVRNRNDLWLNDRGNGIHMWNTTGSVFEGNDIRGGRDGIFINVSHRNTIRGNRIEGCRIAVHYMYAKWTTVEGNLSVGNHVGFALMFSNFITVRNNISVMDDNNALMLHTTHKSEMTGNRVYGTAGKGLFVYTSTGNRIFDNRIESAGIGVHFTGGSNNQFSGNAFIDNRTQVKYSGTQMIEWSREGRGNYWSDNSAFDLNGDGLADQAYRPNSVVDWMVWKYPLSRLLLSSPAMETLRAAQSRFPALYPGGVVDSHPLMEPPPPPVPLPDLDWAAVRQAQADRLAANGMDGAETGMSMH